MTLTLPAFLDALDQWLYEENEPMTAAELRDKIRAAREEVAQHPTPALGWSEWLDWAGGPCPLPGDTTVEVEYIGNASHGYLAAGHDWSRIRRFRYICLPSGWLPRGDFIPPAALWDEACPVRCEWTRGLHRAAEPGRNQLIDPAYWEGITHIRLVAREKACEACEMPEGWRIDKHGILRSPLGVVVLSPDQFKRYGTDTIRRAVDAWLASMKERGNG